MASLNQVEIIGYVGRDAEARYTAEGAAVVNLSIATKEVWKNKEGERQESTEWHRVVLFGQPAEFAAEHVKKGALVYVQGRLKTKTWTDKENIERQSTEIMAGDFQLLDRKENDAPAAS